MPFLTRRGFFLFQLGNIGKKSRRLVFGRFVKTCRDLDIRKRDVQPQKTAFGQRFWHLELSLGNQGRIFLWFWIRYSCWFRFWVTPIQAKTIITSVIFWQNCAIGNYQKKWVWCSNLSKKWIVAQNFVFGDFNFFTISSRYHLIVSNEDRTNTVSKRL